VEPETRNLIMRLATVALAVLLWPATSSAQATGGISLVPPDLRRWDVSGDVGWLSSNKSETGPDWNDWYDVAVGGGSGGYYVTPNLKAELRLAFSGEGSILQEERIDIPEQTFPAFRLREHHFRTTTVRGGVAYQFFENRWFHPHVGAGVEIARESDRMFAQEWRVPSRQPGAPLVIPAVDGGTTVSWAVRPVVSTGFKWYVTERGFVRGDVSVAIGNRRAAQVVWASGIGVDL
jgi:opacity protein-like surface antigen